MDDWKTNHGKGKISGICDRLRYTELDSLHHQEPKPTSPMTNEEPMDEDKAEDSCCWALLAGAVCK